MKRAVLDLFCGAGGATRGYQLAGFHVTGVDIAPQPDYIGDRFGQTDALGYVARWGKFFDFIHASPPCQASCTLVNGTHKARQQGRKHVDLLAETRAALESTGRPYVIEQPVGLADIRKDLVLCGESFGLDVIRHRIFEFGQVMPRMTQPEHPTHRGRVEGWRHGEYFEGPYVAVYGNGGGKGSVARWQEAMGIDWTDNRKSIAEAIPPAYTQWIGERI